MNSNPIIIGGGIAGIATAISLVDAGFKPTLIESRPWLGGRVRSFIDEETGDEIDNGQHLLLGCYHETLSLLERIGTREELTRQTPTYIEFRDDSGRKSALTTSSLLPSPLHIAIAMLRFSRLSLRERRLLLNVGLNLSRRPPNRDETVSAYLKRLGQTPDSCEALWNPLVIATLNTSPDSASAQIFSEVLRRGFLGSKSDGELFIPRTGLSRLLDPAEDYISKKGGRVITGTYVQLVEQDPVREDYQLTLRNGDILHSSTVVSALPWRIFQSLFCNLLPELPAVGTDVPHNAIISTYLWLDKDISSLPAFSAMLGTTTEWMFNRRALTDSPQLKTKDFPGLVTTVISDANRYLEMSSEELITLTEHELRSCFPELSGASVIKSRVIKEKHATFRASPANEELRPDCVTGLPGLYLAGDWTATDLPGTIEGAAISGVKAANAIIQRTP